MESNGVVAMKTSSSTPPNRYRGSSSDLFINLFSPSQPPSSVATDDGEFNEDEILWSSETTDDAINDLQSSFPGNSGILAVLSSESNNRHGHHTVLHRKSSIPKPTEKSGEFKSLIRTRSLSQSVPSSRKFFHQSAPMNVPVLSTAMEKEKKSKFGGIAAFEEEEEEDDDDDDVDDGMMLPPHEMVARGSGVSPRTTFSVLEGVGRTLKGRDLRQVRNAVWRQTGFID
ncbi:hypothetical protein ACFE04_001456 [Oxalis oulophora]